MSTTTTERPPQASAEVAITAIDVEEGFNPRTALDDGRLAELAASIAQNGVVQALTVRPSDQSAERYVLIAGHRRLEAAKLAGLKTVPVWVRDGEGALSAAIAENLIRVDLDPIEEALALARLGEAENLNRAKLAARIGKSTSYIGDRLRLLALPEACRGHFASGKLPLGAERSLREIAKVSEHVAVALADYAVGRGNGEAIAIDVAALIYSLAHAIEAGEISDPPTLIDLGYGQLSIELVEDPQERAELIVRYERACERLGVQARGWGDEERTPSVRLGEDFLDAAHAAGVLLSFGGGDEWQSYRHYLTDREFAADLIRRAVDASVERAAEHQAELAERAAERGEEAPPDPGDGDAMQDARRSERQQRAREAERAARHNEKIGVALLKRRGAGSRKAHSLKRAQAIAKVVIASEPKLAARGLRYVLPQLRELETKTLKSGETRSKLILAEAERCEEYLLKRIEEAKSAQEVLELVADALIAAAYADEREVAGSHRVQFWNRTIDQVVASELGADTKEAKIKRPSRG